MTKPCRHRWKTVKRVACSEHREDGQPEPDPRKRFRVLDVAKCDKCDGAGTRWSRFYGATERAALKRAGVPEHELPPPPNYKPKDGPAAMPLTSWPFPVSTHFPRATP